MIGLNDITANMMKAILIIGERSKGIVHILIILFGWLSFTTSCFAQGKTDFVNILRSDRYAKSANDTQIIFQYQNSNDSVLVALRNKYKLDSIAGFGNNQSRIINVMHWVHNTIRHDGVNESGIKLRNADEILTQAGIRGIGVSCGEIATVLNDCYLALGWKARKIYCFPKDSLKNDPDSHVINTVYLDKKWIMLDASNDAYVMDERASLLSIEEVRARLIAGKPLLVNPDANWNRRISMTLENYIFGYMAKNLYRLYTPIKSFYNYESSLLKDRQYVTLVPIAYKEGNPLYPNILLTDPAIFWQAPNEGN